MQELAIPEGGAGERQREIMNRIRALLAARESGTPPRMRGANSKAAGVSLEACGVMTAERETAIREAVGPREGVEG